MMRLKRFFKDMTRIGVAGAFELGQRVGIDLLPHRFYSEIPTMRELRTSQGWRSARSMIGVAGTDVDEQLELVRACCPLELVERQRVGDIYTSACAENEAGFGPIEADFLHCFVAAQKPKRVVQVGCGVSTAVILRAADEAGYQPSLTCVEPYPTPFLRNQARQGRIELLEQRCQEVALERLAQLEAGDLLFVDSTHTVKPGSEVNLIILELLPRLAGGIWLHFHDIYFPYDYGRSLLTGAIYFGNESTLLHAYMIGNPHIRIAASLSMLHYARTEQLAELLPNYRPAPSEHGLKPSRLTRGHFPSSTYLRTVG